MLDYEKIIDKDEDIALAFIDSWGSVMTSLDTDNSSLSFPLFNPVITPEENLLQRLLLFGWKLKLLQRLLLFGWKIGQNCLLQRVI